MKDRLRLAGVSKADQDIVLGHFRREASGKIMVVPMLASRWPSVRSGRRWASRGSANRVRRGYRINARRYIRLDQAPTSYRPTTTLAFLEASARIRS